MLRELTNQYIDVLADWEDPARLLYEIETKVRLILPLSRPYSLFVQSITQTQQLTSVESRRPQYSPNEECNQCGPMVSCHLKVAVEDRTRRNPKNTPNRIYSLLILDRGTRFLGRRIRSTVLLLNISSVPPLSLRSFFE